MSVADMIKERLQKEKEGKDPKKPEKNEEIPKKEENLKSQPPTEKLEKEDIEALTIDELIGRVGEAKRTPFVKNEYQGRETISASIPGWIKAAVDYISTKDSKYFGFGGKSKFIAEALLSKIEQDYPNIFEKLSK